MKQTEATSEHKVEQKSFRSELLSELRPILMHGAVVLVLIIFLSIVYIVAEWLKKMAPNSSGTIDAIIKMDSGLIMVISGMYSVYTVCILGRILLSGFFDED